MFATVTYVYWLANKTCNMKWRIDWRSMALKLETTCLKLHLQKLASFSQPWPRPYSPLSLPPLFRAHKNRSCQIVIHLALFTTSAYWWHFILLYSFYSLFIHAVPKFIRSMSYSVIRNNFIGLLSAADIAENWHNIIIINWYSCYLKTKKIRH